MKINIKIKNNGPLLANADIQIISTDLGKITIKDFQVWKSKNLNERLGKYINIQPPTIRAFGRYVKRVFFEDEKKWEIIEKSIFDEYQKVEAENTPIDYKEIERIDLSNSNIE